MGLLPDWTDPIGGIQKLIAQKKAEKTANQQLDLSQQELNLAKDAAAQNAARYGDAYSQIFGGSAPGLGPTPGSAPGGGNFVPAANGGWVATGGGYTGSPVGTQGSNGYTYDTGVGRAGQTAEGAGADDSNIRGIDNPANGGLIGGTSDPYSQPFTYTGVNTNSNTYTPGTGPSVGLGNPSGGGLLGQGDAAATAQENAANAALSNTFADLGPVPVSDYVGDVSSQGAQAGANPADVARQQSAMDQLKALTGLQETAQEKALRYAARQKQEQQQKSARDALAADLKSRGVYGSGAEIAGNMGIQQQTNADRTMAELSANANAVNRAMAALGHYNQAAATARGQGAQESQFRGSAADKAAQMNQALREQHNQFQAQTNLQNNRDTAQRAATLRDAQTGTAGAQYGRKQNRANTLINLTGAASGNTNTSVGMVNGATEGVAGALGDKTNVENQWQPKWGINL